MKKTLDFSAMTGSTLVVTMKNGKTYEIKEPTLSMVDAIQSAAGAVTEIAKNSDSDSISALYAFAARIISNNVAGKTVTERTLRKRYHMSADDLIVFFSTYSDFLMEIANQKN